MPSALVIENTKFCSKAQVSKNHLLARQSLRRKSDKKKTFRRWDRKICHSPAKALFLGIDKDQNGRVLFSHLTKKLF
jgi:hypothetical protein